MADFDFDLLRQLKARVQYDLDQSSDSENSVQSVEIQNEIENEQEINDFQLDHEESSHSSESDIDEIKTVNNGELLLMNNKFLKITATHR